MMFLGHLHRQQLRTDGSCAQTAVAQACAFSPCTCCCKGMGKGQAAKRRLVGACG